MVDAHAFIESLVVEAREKGTDFAFGVELLGLERSGDHWRLDVREPDGDRSAISAGLVVNAAGLGADRVAAMTGLAAVVCLALVPLALRWGVRGFTDWRARRRAAARAEKLREKRRERRAVDAEVNRFKRSLRAPLEGCA